MSTGRKPRAVIYARYSSENQHEASIEDQVHACTKLIEEKGWQLVRAYTDRAISGSTVLRPGYQAMLADARIDEFDVVVAEGLDRLSRDQESVAALYKQLQFASVAIFTRSEGEISELHIGLKGTMNALFLKDLAIKTRRGLEGRVRGGHSAGGKAYGYDVIRKLDENGEPLRGERRINENEAIIVKRIFEEFAAGKSPIAIARELNADGIPGPKGKAWRDTAIRGHATRRTGILRNDLYAGRIIWNKQRYVRDPGTGKRLARVNPKEEWITTEAPELRIVSQDLWQKVQERLDGIRQSARSKSIRKHEYWKDRRPRHMLTGLVHCGCCGGMLTAVGQDYLACQAARSGADCSQTKGVKRSRIEVAILEGLKNQLMQPDHVETFISAFNEEVKKQQKLHTSNQQQAEKRLRAIETKLDGLYEAIADGLRTPGLKQKLETLEAEKQQLEKSITKTVDIKPFIHPNLAELYRSRIEALHENLMKPDTRAEALEILRGLIERIDIVHKSDGIEAIITGDIVQLIAKTNPTDVPEMFKSSVKVVAGA